MSGSQAAERPADLVEVRDDGYALEPAPTQRDVVVDERDDTLAGRLAQLPQQASTAATGSDDQRASLVPPPDERADAPRHRTLGEPRRADERRAQQEVDQEDAAWEAVPRDRRPHEEECRSFGHEHGGEDAGRVARARIAPHAAVEAERDECDVARDEHDRQREVQHVPVPDRARRLNPDCVCGHERRADQCEVDEHLDEPPPVDEQRSYERRVLDLGRATHVRQEAAELHEHGERHENTGERHERVVEDLVCEARQPQCRRYGAEQDDGALVGEAPVDQAVRRVIAAALRHRAALDQAHDRDERGVEDRDREDEQRQEQRCHRRSCDGPARGEAERRDREAEQLAAAVAHEDGGRPAEPDVVREEAEAREEEAERERRDQMARMDGERVDREERAGNRGQRCREPVHVVQEVEGVRHPHDPDDADRRGERAVRDDLDADPCREDDRRGRNLREDLRERREPEDVVDEPRGVEQRAARENPAELTCRGNRTHEERDAGRDEEPRQEAASPEQRRRAGVPAVGSRGRDDVSCRGGAEQHPDREQTGRECGECGRGHDHGAARLGRGSRAADSTGPA